MLEKIVPLVVGRLLRLVLMAGTAVLVLGLRELLEGQASNETI